MNRAAITTAILYCEIRGTCVILAPDFRVWSPTLFWHSSFRWPGSERYYRLQSPFVSLIARRRLAALEARRIHHVRGNKDFIGEAVRLMSTARSVSATKWKLMCACGCLDCRRRSSFIRFSAIPSNELTNDWSWWKEWKKLAQMCTLNVNLLYC